MNPLCRGIYAGDSRLLSAKSCFAVPFQIASSHGSVVRGVVKGAGARMGRRLRNIESEEEKLTDVERRWKEKAQGTSVWTLKGGLQDLTDAMVERLNEDPKIEIRLNSPLSAIKSSPSDDRLRLTAISNRTSSSSSSVDPSASSFTLDADHVISSIYAKDLADALSFTSPSGLRENVHAQELAKALRVIPAVTVCVVNLEYSGERGENH